jgi:hypothetical protein
VVAGEAVCVCVDIERRASVVQAGDWRSQRGPLQLQLRVPESGFKATRAGGRNNTHHWAMRVRACVSCAAAPAAEDASEHAA